MLSFRHTKQTSKNVADTTFKDRVVLIREGTNEWEHRTIHSRAGKQTGKDKDWLNIVNEKGNIENIDWKSIKLWKMDLTGSNRVFILQNNTTETEIKEAKVKEFNSWSQNDVYEEVNYRNQKLISTRWVLSEKMEKLLPKQDLLHMVLMSRKMTHQWMIHQHAAKKYYKYHWPYF